MRQLIRILVTAVLVAAGCSSASGTITVDDAWARPAVSTDQATAAYLVLRNASSEADALLGATSPAAARVEVHESTETDGMMAMHPVNRVEIPAGGSVELKPGGFHLMLMDLASALEPGSTIELTLELEHAGTIRTTAEVRTP